MLERERIEKRILEERKRILIKKIKKKILKKRKRIEDKMLRAEQITINREAKIL
jgi:hypothetical protein